MLKKKVDSIFTSNGQHIYLFLLGYKIREKILIAPMIDVTDNYFRYFARFITKHSFCWTQG